MADIKSNLKKITKNSYYENPFDDVVKPSSSAKFLEDDEILNSKKKQKNEKDKNPILSARTQSEKLNKHFDLNKINDFDDYLEERFEIEEDANLRNSLVNLGRQYARNTSIDPVDDEISKRYAPQEKMIKKIIDDSNKDYTAVTKDVDNIRQQRTRNYKTMSDLIIAQNQVNKTRLDAIKELNSINKHIIDTATRRAGSKSNEPSVGDNMVSSSVAIQQLLSNRNSITNDTNGYTSISGSFTNEDDMDEDMNEEIMRRKHGFDKREMTIEEKKMLYEGRGIRLVLIMNENNSVESIIAEDGEGNYVPDYPIEDDLIERGFNIDSKTKTATDAYFNNYIVRYQ